MQNARMNSFMSTIRPGRNSPKTRQHRCSICGQTFARTEHLTRHERSHRGDKPFQCNHCDFQFCRKDLLKRHVGRLHPHEVGNPEPWAVGAPSQNAPQDSQFDSTKQASDLNFDSVLNWGPTTVDFAGMYCQPTTIPVDISNTVNMDIDNLISDIYYGDGALDFQDIDILATLPSTSQIDVSKPQSTADLQYLTQLTPAATTIECNEVSETPARGTFDVSESKRIDLISAIVKAQPKMEVTLPSCLTLERFIVSCFDSLYVITPCVHIPTWRAEDAHPCLFLAMAACGAKYCEREDLALSLHKMARVVILDQVRCADDIKLKQPTWLIHALFLITGFGVWSGQLDACRGALADHSLLAQLLNSEEATGEDQDAQASGRVADNWEAFITTETTIRTKYTIFYYLCLVTMVFDIPPILRSSEIDLILPCSEAEWTAPSAQDWARCRKDPAQRFGFTGVLHGFLDPSVASTPLDSPFAGLLILHALIQQIWFWRQDRWYPSPELQFARFRSALDKLESAARFGSESTVSPYNSRAALVYNFHSLLRLARVYLCADMGKLLTTFRTHNVKTISQAMATQLTVGRSAEASQAALHATQSLRVPLRFGVILKSGCGTMHYYFNTLECGLYLCRWVQALQGIPEVDWTEKEKDTVSIIQSTVNEAELPPDKAARPLSAQVAYACSIILKGANTWGLSPLLLTALNEYASGIQV